MDTFLHILILVCAVVAFAVSWHIFDSKKIGKKIICPTDSDCEMVIHSEYSTWRGIPWEKIGMAYFGAIAVFYFVVTISFLTVSDFAFGFIMAPTVLAAGVSVYLVYIQGQKIKEWCSICLFTSLLSLSIFLASLSIWF